MPLELQLPTMTGALVETLLSPSELLTLLTVTELYSFPYLYSFFVLRIHNAGFLNETSSGAFTSFTGIRPQASQSVIIAYLNKFRFNEMKTECRNPHLGSTTQPPILPR